MSFIVKKTYTFNTLAPAILGSSYKNAEMLGEISYEIAITRENIDLKYRQIYPVLPPNTTDSPKTQKYFIFRTETGQLVTLCEQWIDMASVREVGGVNFTVSFKDAEPADKNRIRAVLSAMGYTNFTIS